jgi:hypothetical protein
MLNIIIQIILGLFIILIMALIAYSIYDREYLRSINVFNTNKKETRIFKGVYPYNQNLIKVEAFNKSDPYYFDLNPSVNQNGGAEYSYNFWLYFNIKETDDKIYNNTNDGNNNNDRYIVLFYKGAKQLIPYKQHNYSCDTKKNDGTSKKYILVKNPLVKLNNNGKELVIEYNNINTPDTFNSTSSPLNCNTIQSIYENNKNKLGIKNIDTKMYNKTYNMITIVMQESPSNEDVLFQNRTNCKVYFNGSLISDRSTYNNDIANENNVDLKSTVMKKNLGNLYINPATNLNEISSEYVNTAINEITDSDEVTIDVPLKIADLSYFNYALSVDEIYTLYNRGFNNELADIIVKNNSIINKDILVGRKINFDIYNSDNYNLPVESI